RARSRPDARRARRVGEPPARRARRVLSVRAGDHAGGGAGDLEAPGTSGVGAREPAARPRSGVGRRLPQRFLSHGARSIDLILGRWYGRAKRSEPPRAPRAVMEADGEWRPVRFATGG